MTFLTTSRSRPFRVGLGKLMLLGLLAAVSVLGAARDVWAGYYGRAAVGYDYEYTYVPERLSREHRLGAEVDDWLERGNATVTVSPVFEDGIRVAAWANGPGDPEAYDFGLASAIYYFDIPRGARQIDIRIRYEGDGDALDLNGEAVAGRVWLRDARAPRSDDPNAVLEGDTFVLRARRRSETIRVPAAKYVDNNGVMEMHVVADGSNRIDVAYIDVETYTREREVRVVRRYVPAYRWRPWYAYTYQYFYGGSFFFPTDYGYYLYWGFPLTDPVYVGIHHRYYGYLNNYYYARHPYRRVYVNPYARSRTLVRRPVNRWSPQLNRVRDEYERGRGSKARGAPDEAIQLRQAVATALQSYSESPTPSTHIAAGYEKRRRSAPDVRTDAFLRSLTETYERVKTRRTMPSSEYRARSYEEGRGSSRTAPSSDWYTKRRRSTSTPSYSAPARSSEPTQQRSETTSTKKRRSSVSSSTSSSRSSPSKSSSSTSDDDNKKKRRR